jgi:hypothetical protein
VQVERDVNETVVVGSRNINESMFGDADGINPNTARTVADVGVIRTGGVNPTNSNNSGVSLDIKFMAMLESFQKMTEAMFQNSQDMKKNTDETRKQSELIQKFMFEGKPTGRSRSRSRSKPTPSPSVNVGTSIIRPVIGKASKVSFKKKQYLKFKSALIELRSALKMGKYIASEKIKEFTKEEKAINSIKNVGERSRRLSALEPEQENIETYKQALDLMNRRIVVLKSERDYWYKEYGKNDRVDQEHKNADLLAEKQFLSIEYYLDEAKKNTTLSNENHNKNVDVNNINTDQLSDEERPDIDELNPSSQLSDGEMEKKDYDNHNVALQNIHALNESMLNVNNNAEHDKNVNENDNNPVVADGNNPPSDDGDGNSNNDNDSGDDDRERHDREHVKRSKARIKRAASVIRDDESFNEKYYNEIYQQAIRTPDLLKALGNLGPEESSIFDEYAADPIDISESFQDFENQLENKLLLAVNGDMNRCPRIDDSLRISLFAKWIKTPDCKKAWLNRNQMSQVYEKRKKQFIEAFGWKAHDVSQKMDELVWNPGSMELKAFNAKLMAFEGKYSRLTGFKYDQPTLVQNFISRIGSDALKEELRSYVADQRNTNKEVTRLQIVNHAVTHNAKHLARKNRINAAKTANRGRGGAARGGRGGGRGGRGERPTSNNDSSSGGSINAIAKNDSYSTRFGNRSKDGLEQKEQPRQKYNCTFCLVDDHFWYNCDAFKTAGHKYRLQQHTNTNNNSNTSTTAAVAQNNNNNNQNTGRMTMIGGDVENKMNNTEANSIINISNKVIQQEMQEKVKGLSYFPAYLNDYLFDSILMDPGCSEPAAISSEFYNELKTKDPSLVLNECSSSLGNATKGSRMEVLGKCNIEIKDTKRKSIGIIPFTVIRNLSQSVIVGNPINQLGSTSEYNNGKAWFTIKVPENKSARFRLKIHNPDLEQLQVFPVHLKNEILLKSHETAAVRCTVNLKGRKRLQANEDIWITINPDLKQHAFKWSPTVSVIDEDGTIRVYIKNITENEVIVNPHHVGFAVVKRNHLQVRNINMISNITLQNHELRPDEELKTNTAVAKADDSPDIIDEPLSNRIGLDSLDEARNSIMKLDKPKNLNEEQWKHYRDTVLLPYLDIMVWKKKDPDEAEKILGSHKIELIPDTQPINQRPYPTTVSGREAIRNEVGRLREDGVTSPSISPWASPPIIQKKPNGKWRFIVDLRGVNSKTIKDVYPLPRIDVTLDQLRKAKYITTVDLKSGYFQIPIRKEDRSKTAFIFDGGLEEFMFMAQGLCNAPSTFQRIMDKVLAGYKYNFCYAYLDDIIIFSESWEEHVKQVKLVFDRLREYQLSISLEKCQFATDEVKFLGHIISNGTISPDPAKIEAIKIMKPPTNVSQLRSFLGLVNYYRNFIPSFAKIAKPLHTLSSIKSTWNWNNNHTTAFMNLKDALINYPVLRCSNPDKPFIIHTDASGNALGAVLAQQDNDGNEYAISYISRVLNTHEKNYDTTQKECLAVVWAVKKWYEYIGDKSFVIFTDHSALKWLLKLKAAPNQRLARWILQLQQYDFEVRHRPGIKHQNADALSRLVIIANIFDVTDQSLMSKLREFQSADLEIKSIIELIETGDALIGETTKIRLEKLVRDHKLVVKDGILYHEERETSSEIEKLTPFIPPLLRSDILVTAHDGDLSGHCGERMMYYNIRAKCYWPGISRDVTNYVRHCHHCQLAKTKPSLAIPSLPMPIPSHPFFLVGMDIMELPLTQNGNRYLLVFTDYLTKWVEAVPIMKRDAPTVALALLSMVVSRHGVPVMLLSDQGGEFCESVMKVLMGLLQIKKLNTSPYHPQCNGLTERFNRTLISMLRTYADSINPQEWDERLPLLLLAYRAHYNRNAKKSPFYLLYGRNPIIPADFVLGNSERRYGSRDEFIREHVDVMPSIWKFVTENLEVQSNRILEENQKLMAENRLQLFDVGDKVYAFINVSVGQRVEYKTKPTWKGPFVVSKIISLATYEIMDETTGKKSIIWSGHLKLARDVQSANYLQNPNFGDDSID